MHQFAALKDRYEVLEQIGSGGMGAVYRAYHFELQRSVAIKGLNANETVAGVRERFKREALALSKLEHSNIVKLFGFEEHSGHLFLVMEFVSGVTLQEHVQQIGKINAVDAVKLVKQLCDALGVAHSNNIIHRDIKPSNVMLQIADDGKPIVKLVDFGLARFRTDHGMQQITAASGAVGTAMYMSPEQCAGQNADERSDIYATGCLLYYCLTGAPPYPGEQSLMIMREHLISLPPGLCAFGADDQAALEDVVWKAMAKNPDSRYSSAAAFGSDLLALQEGNTVSAHGTAAEARRDPNYNKWLRDAGFSGLDKAITEPSSSFISDLGKAASTRKLTSRVALAASVVLLGATLVFYMQICSTADFAPASNARTGSRPKHLLDEHRSAKALLEEGLGLCERRKPEGFTLLKQALAKARLEGNDSLTADCLIHCAAGADCYSSVEEARAYIKEAKTILDAHKDDQTYLWLRQQYWHYLGGFHSNRLNESSEAERAFIECISTAQKCNWEPGDLAELRKSSYGSLFLSFVCDRNEKRAHHYQTMYMRETKLNRDAAGCLLLAAALSNWTDKSAPISQRVIEYIEHEKPFGGRTAKLLTHLQAILFMHHKYSDSVRVGKIAMKNYESTGMSATFRGYAECLFLLASSEAQPGNHAQAKIYAADSLRLFNDAHKFSDNEIMARPDETIKSELKKILNSCN